MVDDQEYFFEGPSGKHIMFTIGDDFQYMNAAQNYWNWDRMIKYFNAKYTKHGVKLMYSTPHCVVKSIREEGPHAWTVKNDDFFPYADGNQSYAMK